MKEGVVVKCLQAWEAVLMKENIQMLKRDSRNLPITALPTMVATSHMKLLSTENVAIVFDERFLNYN